MIQNAATDEKSCLEEEQRAAARHLKTTGLEYTPKYFELDETVAVGHYCYRHADVRPWDPRNDLYQYEKDYIICTKTKHKTPMIRTQSIVSVSDAAKKAATTASEKARRAGSLSSHQRRGSSKDESDSKLMTPPGFEIGVKPKASPRSSKAAAMAAAAAATAEARSLEASGNLEVALQPLKDQQRQMTERLVKLQHTLDCFSNQQKERDSNSNINRDMVLLVVLVVMIQVMRLD